MLAWRLIPQLDTFLIRRFSFAVGLTLTQVSVAIMGLRMGGKISSWNPLTHMGTSS